MGNLVSAIVDFARKILTIVIISAGILLFATEVKLAELKKASQGSVKLSTFKHKMTETHTNY